MGYGTKQNMEIITWSGKRKLPTSVTEYFVALYCKRRKLKPHIGLSGGLTCWKSLSSAEKEIYTEKFEKWQEENDKKMFHVLENAEPFLKEKTTIENTETRNYENQSIIHLTEKTIDNISNADSESTKLENTDADSQTNKIRNDYDDYQTESMIHHSENIDDNISNVGSEVSNQYYAASVIDRDIDEPTDQQETRGKISEPIPPPNLKAREMFETIKSNGTRPDLATVEWMHLSARDKTLYRNAAIRIKKNYLNKYEQYLESLSDPELFKLYIKTLEN